jgi:hypothetical protein
MVFRLPGGCMRRLLTLLLIAVVALAVWRFQGELAGLWNDMRSTRSAAPAEPSIELAEGAERKLAALAGRSAPEQVVLSEVELQSLVRYRLADALPPFLDSPRVQLEGDRIRVHVRVATDRFPRVPEFREIMGFLPDTTEVAARAQLIPLGRGRIGLAVDEVAAARIPLPKRFIPMVLDRLGRTEEPGLPPDAVAVPLPQGAAGAYVRGGSLVFLSRVEPGPSE